MSTQMSSMLEESYQIFQRIFNRLEEFSPLLNLVNCRDKSKSIDKTFEESVIKTRTHKLTQVATKLQNSIVEFMRTENQQALKYEEQLQLFQSKLRVKVKTQIEHNLLVEALEEQNFQLRKQVLTLKEQVVELQNHLEGTENRMKTEIHTLQTEIANFKRLDHLIRDNNLQDSESNKPDDKMNDDSSPKKKNIVSLIKNRLSLCDPNDFQLNMWQQITPYTRKQVNLVEEVKLRNFQKKTPKQQLVSLSSRKSSARSLHRKPIGKQIDVKQDKNSQLGKSPKKKKLLILNQLQSKQPKHRKSCQNKTASKLKIKK